MVGHVPVWGLQSGTEFVNSTQLHCHVALLRVFAPKRDVCEMVSRKSEMKAAIETCPWTMTATFNVRPSLGTLAERLTTRRALDLIKS